MFTIHKSEKLFLDINFDIYVVKNNGIHLKMFTE